MLIPEISIPNSTTDKSPRTRRWIPLSLRMFVVMLMLLGGGSVLWVGLPAYRQRVKEEKKDAEAAEVVIQPGGELDAGVMNEDHDRMLYGPVKENGVRNIAWRSSKLGNNVEVDGLAIGKPTDFRVLYDGSKIFVRTVNIKDQEIDGRLVRVKGILRFQEGVVIRHRIGEGDKSDTTQPYFYIEALTVEVIDRVTAPRLVSQDL